MSLILRRCLNFMRKYNGQLILQLHDEDGIIEVVEAHGERSLHFGSNPKQSSMALDAPDKLQLSYCRAMMSWRLFKDSFDDALLIGLGGGSLAKYLLRHFTGKIEAIELRQRVVEIAHRYFYLPENPRLTVRIGDGGEHVRHCARYGWQRYDLILIDAFDHETMSASVNGAAFFDACGELLRPCGIMVINLWGANNPHFERTVNAIHQSFAGKLLFVPVSGKDNVIALGFSAATPVYCMQQIRRQAEVLEERSQIEYPAFLKALKKYNGATLRRIMQ